MSGWRFTPLAAPLVVGAALMVGLGVFVRWRKPPRSGNWLALLSLATCVYVLGYALELGSATVAQVQRFLQLEYLGVANLPTLVLLLALSYTGRDRFATPLRVALLFALPATTCACS